MIDCDFKRQPWKTIYICFAFLYLILVLIPWWIIRNLLPTWRPRQSWCLSWCLETNYLKYMFKVSKRTDSIHMAGPLDTRPDHLGLYIEGASPRYITGEVKKWAEYAGVSPSSIPGYWINGPRTSMQVGEMPAHGEKVLLYFHGGDYTTLSAHPDSPTSAIPRSILQQCTGLYTIKRAFSVEYRLSSIDPRKPGNPFPAALLDALAGYIYLVSKVGFDAKNVVIVGDASGGNLTIALTRYLIDMRNELGDMGLAPPGAIILISPWADLGRSNSGSESNTMRTNTRSDYLESPVILANGRARPEDSQRAFAQAGPHGLAFLDSETYVSPASLFLHDEEVSFVGFPETLVICGGAELFLDQIRTLSRRMRRDIGEHRVVYHEAEDAVHDYMWVEWQEVAKMDTLRVIEQWIVDLWT